MSDQVRGIVTKPGRNGSSAGPYDKSVDLAQSVYSRYEDIPVDKRQWFYRGKDGKWHDIDRDPPRVTERDLGLR